KKPPIIIAYLEDQIMNKRHVLTPIALALIFASVCGVKRSEARQNTQTPTPNAVTPGPNLEGVWEGALEVGATKFRLALKVAKAADGALTAKFDSLDHGASDLPVDV